MANLYNTRTPDNVVQTFNFWQIGFMAPIKAEIPTDYFAPNQIACWPEVIEWPYSADDNGISFDTANLLGVRCYARRNCLIPDGGGDPAIWIPVPKTLPGAYTETRRGSILYGPGYPEPENKYTSYNMRTATGLYYPEASPSPWVPQGRNTTALIAYMGLFSTWQNISITPYEWLSPVTGPSELGYRSGSFFRSGSGVGSYSVSLQIEFVPDGSSTPQIVQTIAVSEGGTSSSDYPLTSMVAPNGVAGSFQARVSVPVATIDVDEFLSSPVQEFHLGYRTDIPLWFFSASGNLVAPGGVLT